MLQTREIGPQYSCIVETENGILFGLCGISKQANSNFTSDTISGASQLNSLILSGRSPFSGAYGRGKYLLRLWPIVSCLEDSLLPLQLQNKTLDPGERHQSHQVKTRAVLPHLLLPFQVRQTASFKVKPPLKLRLSSRPFLTCAAAAETTCAQVTVALTTCLHFHSNHCSLLCRLILVSPGKNPLLKACDKTAFCAISIQVLQKLNQPRSERQIFQQQCKKEPPFNVGGSDQDFQVQPVRGGVWQRNCLCADFAQFLNKIWDSSSWDGVQCSTRCVNQLCQDKAEKRCQQNKTERQSSCFSYFSLSICRSLWPVQQKILPREIWLQRCFVDSKLLVLLDQKHTTATKVLALPLPIYARRTDPTDRINRTWSRRNFCRTLVWGGQTQWSEVWPLGAWFQFEPHFRHFPLKQDRWSWKICVSWKSRPSRRHESATTSTYC